MNVTHVLASIYPSIGKENKNALAMQNVIGEKLLHNNEMSHAMGAPLEMMYRDQISKERAHSAQLADGSISKHDLLPK